jgi:hypothetical protein
MTETPVMRQSMELVGIRHADPDWGDTSCDIGVNVQNKKCTYMLYCICGSATVSTKNETPEQLADSQFKCRNPECRKAWIIRYRQSSK